MPVPLGRLHAMMLMMLSIIH